jgi:hypothetical protein
MTDQSSKSTGENIGRSDEREVEPISETPRQEAIENQTIRTTSRFHMSRLTLSGQYRVVTRRLIPRKSIFGGIRYRRVWELERVELDPTRRTTIDRCGRGLDWA